MVCRISWRAEGNQGKHQMPEKRLEQVPVSTDGKVSFLALGVEVTRSKLRWLA